MDNVVMAVGMAADMGAGLLEGTTEGRGGEMATTVRITETYDMKTTVNKMGLIAVHTPSIAFVNRMYPGLCKNHKFLRVLRCDVVGACASVLPADPLQVGVEDGDVAPEDLFNPILYRAMTNEGFETLLNRLYSATQINAGFGSLSEASLDESVDSFKLYYSLLAENRGWKKVMPQNGFNIRGLYPICYEMINSYGNEALIGTRGNVVGQGGGAVTPTDDSAVNITGNTLAALTGLAPTRGVAITFRGRSVKMPRVPLHYSVESGSGGSSIGPVIPKIFVMGMCLPPARLHEFWYRMRVSWTLRFEDVISTGVVGDATTLQAIGEYSYTGPTYESSKAELQNQEDTVDTNDVSIKKIMES